MVEVSLRLSFSLPLSLPSSRSLSLSVDPVVSLARSSIASAARHRYPFFLGGNIATKSAMKVDDAFANHATSRSCIDDLGKSLDRALHEYVHACAFRCVVHTRARARQQNERAPTRVSRNGNAEAHVANQPANRSLYSARACVYVAIVCPPTD